MINKLSRIYHEQLKNHGYSNAQKLHSFFKYWLKLYFITKSKNIGISQKTRDILGFSITPMEKKNQKKRAFGLL